MDGSPWVEYEQLQSRFRAQAGELRAAQETIHQQVAALAQLRQALEQARQPLDDQNRLQAVETDFAVDLSLKKEQAFRNLIIERASEGLCVCHNTSEFPYLSFTVWNRRMTEITGYTRDEINTRGWYQSMYPDPEQQALAIGRMAAMREGSDLVDEEWEITHADGRPRYVLISTSVLAVEGNTKHVLGLMHDITEAIHVREALKASEENFRTFYNSIDECLFVVNHEGEILHVNDTATAKLGYPVEEMVGRHVLEFYPPDRRDEAARIVGDMVAGQVSACPIPLLTKDGRLFPVETRVLKGRWDNRDVLFGISKDLSDVCAAEERFSKAFHCHPSPMAITSLTKHCLIDVNDAFLKTLGYERHEVIGSVVPELRLFADPSQREAALAAAEVRGSLRDFEADIRTKSGLIRHGLFSAEFIQLQDQRVLLTVMNDITDRKQAQEILKRAHEEQLEKHRAELSHLARLTMMGEMAATLAHELNQPLHAITSYANGGMLRMAKSPQADEQLVMAMQQIAAEAHRAADVVRRIRRFVKKQELQRSAVSINSLIEEVLVLAKAELDKADAQVALEFSPDPPIVLGDSVELEQVVLNLVRNGLEAMDSPPNAEKSLVIRTARDATGWVLVEVRDSGKGIAKQDLEKVFEPFYTTKPDGMGMGLAISRSIVHAHGGRLWLSINRDQGCTFHFTLPEVQEGRP